MNCPNPNCGARNAEFRGRDYQGNEKWKCRRCGRVFTTCEEY